jgi:Suppressor of fused protein (SUFU)
MTDVDEAPGWDAIEAAVEAVVPAQEPLHWGTNTLPGQDGIYGLSAYLDGTHWLLVTFGLTELFGKVGEDPVVSGWGFELTMRVPADDNLPPAWALRLLERLGQYVYSGQKPLAPGHRLDPGGPITGAAGTRLTALAFTADPQLPAIDTPHGAVQFLAVVGITAEELAQMKASSTDRVLADLAAVSPLLVTDPQR